MRPWKEKEHLLRAIIVSDIVLSPPKDDEAVEGKEYLKAREV